MSATSTELYIKNQFQLQLMKRIAVWFSDQDDATNWFMYQKLNYFGGMTAEEILLEQGVVGYNALIKYAEEKEQQILLRSSR
ncbi:MAG: hypothetical protein HRT37_24400 [Alteromonadaceae bacterium]|nr:hypothetical protein [Alteromonadaceae bacterium]